MILFTEEHLLLINRNIAKTEGGFWTENKGELNVKSVIKIINDVSLSFEIRAAKTALAITALQIFRDGNHRTAIVLLHYLMICGKMMPRKSPLHIYGKLEELSHPFEHEPEEEGQNAIALKLAVFMGKKYKKWRNSDYETLAHMDQIIPVVYRQVDKFAGQLADISRIRRFYAQKGSRLSVMDSSSFYQEDTNKIRMFVAYSRASGYTF